MPKRYSFDKNKEILEKWQKEREQAQLKNKRPIEWSRLVKQRVKPYQYLGLEANKHSNRKSLRNHSMQIEATDNSMAELTEETNTLTGDLTMADLAN